MVTIQTGRKHRGKTREALPISTPYRATVGRDAHLVRLRQSDALLAVGGAVNTYQVGLAAIAAKKPLVPIGSFGGAATKLLQSLYMLNVPFPNELNLVTASTTA